MTVATNQFSTDQLWMEATALRGEPRRYKLPNHEFELFLQHDRICLFTTQGESPIGIIRFGGPCSGAIWLQGRLVGEYDKTLEGQYILIRVEDGFKVPESKQEKDPLLHLVEQAYTTYQYTV